MKSRLTGAILRAVLVMTVIVLPAAVVVDVSGDTRQMVTLAAILLGAVTFAEYNATYPSLVEFRDAAPYNRLRFALLASSLAAVMMAYPLAVLPPDIQAILAVRADKVGAAMDFPFSPARLIYSLAQDQAAPAQLELLRNSAGLAYLVSLSWLAVFAVMVRIGGWPSSHKPLNLWVNLPMFDPSLGSDVVRRLGRDGRINILLGFILPFALPVLAQFLFKTGLDLGAAQAHSLIWIVTIWAFFPASLILRGFALLRIAELIEQTRAAHLAAQTKTYVAV